MNNWHGDTAALVTGGSQGLGLAIAVELIAQGCRTLTLASHDAAKGEAAARDLTRDDVTAHFVHVDMGNADAAIKMVDDAARLMGRVTALVNCAADTGRGSILDTTPAVYDHIMDVNTKGPYFALQRFAQRAIDAGHTGGAVNILSIVMHGGTSFLSPYGASKAALAFVTKNAAAALAKHRIRVNGVNVGWMDTPGEDARQRGSHNRPEGWLKDVEASLPFGQLVKPDEVARLVAYLLGPQSGVVTGSIIDFDQQVVGTYPDTDDT